MEAHVVLLSFVARKHTYFGWATHLTSEQAPHYGFSERAGAAGD